MEIIQDEKILKQVSKSITKEEAEQTGIFRQLDLMLRATEGGFGLAAIQIGIPVRACIIRMPSCCVNLLNPRIVEKSEPCISQESCLSLPGIVKKVPRHYRIHVVDDLRPEGYIAEGIEAFVVEHEINHMDGILITDYSPQPIIAEKKPGPNEKCPCGSGKKYKKCCEIKS